MDAQFPLYIPLGPFRIHPHIFFDVLSYAVATRLYLWQAKSTIPAAYRWKIIGGALLGAVAGAVLVDLFLDPSQWLVPGVTVRQLLFQGKTVVGGLLGGLAGVELMKKYCGYDRSTGDAFVVPLLIGIGLGRVGCFLTGLTDNTYGGPTTMPWGVDFGDGVQRHPTQLYEILFILVLAVFLRVRKSHPYDEGDLFRFFMIAYLFFRFMADFLKPYPRVYVGLNVIQLACVAGLIYYAKFIPRLFLFRTERYA